MDANFKYRKAFLIIAYGVLLQFFILPFYEIPALLDDKTIKQYIISKGLIFVFYFFYIGCLHTKRFANCWKIFFHCGFFLFILVGEYFNPGYQYAVIEFMFISVIIFEGFPAMSTLLMVLYLLEHSYFSFSKSSFEVWFALIFSWGVTVALEHFVNRLKFKKSALDHKLRYKGIKTDLFLHDLKNNLQTLMSLYPKEEKFKKVVKMVQNFNSFNDNEEVLFSEVIIRTKEKFNISGDIIFLGSENFFLDQMDLETILCNLMNNSYKASQIKNIPLVIKIRNKFGGFSYEDNAGGMTDEQYKFFGQKNFKPYSGHEKNGLGLLLIKKLIECQEGKLIIKKIPNGTRFEINY